MIHVGSIRRLKRKVHARLCDETNARASSSAIVFAPHQDDETLGCGGTMILKCKAGAPLACVFMTDGATSHQAFIDAEELRRLRRAEALQATAVLGLPADRVEFLGFPDGRLSGVHEAAVEHVAAIVDRCAPEEVYVPYSRDGTADHEATYRIVIDALRSVGRQTRVLEYPIWFWNRWPWVSFKLEAKRSLLGVLSQVMDARFGLEVLREFRTGVLVAPVIETKRKALTRHRSQMTALLPETGWPTLPGVSNGELLDCLFQDFEVFRSSHVAGNGRPPRGSQPLR